jgi:peroxiredoxin
MLGQGDKLPSVTVADDTGAPFDTRSLVGTTTVLWFYPKDDTPG